MNNRTYIQISYIIGKDSGVGALRNFYFFEHFGNTFANKYLFSTTKIDLKEKEIGNWAAPIDYTLFFTNSNRRITQNKNTLFYKIIARLKNSFPFFFLLNLGGPYYIIKGYRKIMKYCKNTKHIFLYSSYDPMADHIIAYLLKRRNNNIFWIADFRDLPVDPIKKNSLWPVIDKWFLKKLLTKADLVTTVSNGLAKHFFNIHDDVLVIPNAIDTELINNQKTIEDNILKIGYTGSIHQSLQVIDPLLKVCIKLKESEQINQIELHYAGPQSDYWRLKTMEYNLEDIFIDHGNVAREKAIKLQRSNHINVLFTWSFGISQGQMTMKFYEYLASRRKLLVIVNGIKDKEIGNILDNTESGMQFTTEELEDMTAYCIGTSKSPNSLNPLEKLGSYTWNNRIKNLTEYLESH